ncbi:MAG: hypothetical protein L0H84_01775 [Pseudonocardia sp.]|nr:hypothetical protein [Pseudonocardia sp.]
MPGGPSPLVGLVFFVVAATCPALVVWAIVRFGPMVVDRIGDRWRRRRREPDCRPLESEVASLRRLRRELRNAPPTTNVRAQALTAAYDDALIEVCRIVGVDPPLAGADGADRAFARLQTEAALEQAGIALDPPGSVTAG